MVTQSRSVDKVHPHLYSSELQIDEDSLFICVVCCYALGHREPHCGTAWSCFLRGESRWSYTFVPSGVLASAEAAVKQRHVPPFLICHGKTKR